METRIFAFESQIKKFLTAHSEYQHYVILEKMRTWWLGRRWKVLFYNNEDVISHLLVAGRDLIEEEFGLELRDMHVQVFAPADIEIRLDTSRNPLIFGRMGQNQKALELFFARAVSFQFRMKYYVRLKIVNSTGKPFVKHTAYTAPEDVSAPARSVAHRARPVLEIRADLDALLESSKQKCLTSHSPVKIPGLNSAERKKFHQHFREHNQIKCYSQNVDGKRLLILEKITAGSP